MAEIINIKTPDKIELDGFWLGPKKASKVYIYIHGLSSSVFSKVDLLQKLTDKKTAVLTFNNRGHDKVTRVKKIDERKSKGYKSVRAGGAYEKFTDSQHDIQGAVDFAKKRCKKIILIGHSTGCQKAVYYLSQKDDKKVAGAILLAPMSDYSVAIKDLSKRKLNSLVNRALVLVKKGRADELMPLSLWPQFDSAHRFLSLYTSNSKEEIFTYAQTDKKPVTFLKVKKPLLILLAAKDEYADRPIRQIAEWFDKFKNQKSTVKIIKNTNHSFNNSIAKVAKQIKQWNC